MTAVAPDGQMWKVRRRLAPRLGTETAWGRFHKRYRQTISRIGDVADADPGCLDVFGEGIVAAIGIIIALVVLIFVIIPLLVAIVDMLIVILLALVGIGARIVLRRPWIVEAARADGLAYRWRVFGWKASGTRVAKVAKQIESGEPPSMADAVL